MSEVTVPPNVGSEASRLIPRDDRVVDASYIPMCMRAIDAPRTASRPRTQIPSNDDASLIIHSIVEMELCSLCVCVREELQGVHVRTRYKTFTAWVITVSPVTLREHITWQPLRGSASGNQCLELDEANHSIQ